MADLHHCVGTDASEDDIVTTKKRSKSNSSSDNFSSSEDGDLFGNKTRSSDVSPTLPRQFLVTNICLIC